MLPTLHYFEVHLTDHCNLNCWGCNHFSPIATESFTDINVFENDIKRLSKLIKSTNVCLLGGEPLLHSKLTSFLRITRKYFTLSRIRLLTNGTLLLEQTDDFWNSCRDNNIIIEITKYPINLDFITIEKKCMEKGVCFEYHTIYSKIIDPKLMTKNCFDLKGRQDIKISSKKCPTHYLCSSLNNGKLYPCSIIPYIKYFNKYFNCNLEVSEKDGIDIHKNINGYDILKFLSLPVPFCRYCDISNRIEGIPWSVSNKEITEWV